MEPRATLTTTKADTGTTISRMKPSDPAMTNGIQWLAKAACMGWGLVGDGEKMSSVVEEWEGVPSRRHPGRQETMAAARWWRRGAGDSEP